MTHFKLLLALAVTALVVLGSLPAADELQRRATWSIPTTADVKARLDDYLATKTLDETARLKIEALWPDEATPLAGPELLDRLAASLAVIEPRAAEIVTAVQQPAISLPPPKFPALEDNALPDFVRDNLRLTVGRWLAQHDLV